MKLDKSKVSHVVLKIAAAFYRMEGELAVFPVARLLLWSERLSERLYVNVGLE
jgi:hypothetical protein